MCRSIKTLRPPMTPDPRDEDVRAAALQYVRKVSGFRSPAAHNRAVFDEAVDAVAEATRRLLGGLEVRGSTEPQTDTTGQAGTAGRSSPVQSSPVQSTAGQQRGAGRRSGSEGRASRP